MFNIGPGELIAISMVALIVLGPQRLPHAVRTVGRVIGEVRRISGGFQDELRNAFEDSELDDLRRRDVTPPSLPPLPDDLRSTAHREAGTEDTHDTHDPPDGHDGRSHDGGSHDTAAPDPLGAPDPLEGPRPATGPADGAGPPARPRPDDTAPTASDGEAPPAGGTAAAAS